MPEASVDEDGHAVPREREIGSHAPGWERDRVVDSVPEALSMEGTPKTQFRLRITTAVGTHDRTGGRG